MGGNLLNHGGSRLKVTPAEARQSRGRGKSRSWGQRCRWSNSRDRRSMQQRHSRSQPPKWNSPPDRALPSLMHCALTTRETTPALPPTMFATCLGYSQVRVLYATFEYIVHV